MKDAASSGLAERLRNGDVDEAKQVLDLRLLPEGWRKDPVILTAAKDGIELWLRRGGGYWNHDYVREILDLGLIDENSIEGLK